MNAKPGLYAEVLSQHVPADSTALVYVAEIAWIEMYFLGHKLSKALSCLDSRGPRRSAKAARAGTLAIEAKKTLIIEKDLFLAKAREYGMTVIALDAAMFDPAR